MTLVSQYRPIILQASSQHDSKILTDYAEFWKIPWTAQPTEDHQQTIVTTSHPTPSTRDSTIITSPSGLETAEKIAREHGLTVTSKELLVRLPIAPDATVSMITETYQFSGPNLDPVLKSGDVPILSRIRGTNHYLVGVDLVGEYTRRVSAGIEDKPSRKFWLATKLPFSYQSIPRFIRERSFRSSRGHLEITEEKLGPVECLRTIFLASLVASSGPIPRIAFWKRGKSYALALTHDVETQTGLEQGTARFIALEHSLGIRSTWNLPSDRYPLSSESLATLSENGEIGAHDTAHDGRLIFLNFQDKVQRLRECKQRLEKLTGQEIRGFRSPLLQHSFELASATEKAGYAFDSSCPSWEILSPTSLHSHGLSTVFPLEIAGTLEIPVSLPQDHQLVRVAGLRPQAAIEQWALLSKWIRALGGTCVLLIHPDYEFAMREHLGEYRNLLESFVMDPQCDIMTIGEIAAWWKHRAGARWETKDGRLTVSQEGPVDLQTELVTAYGRDGFSSEILS